MRTLHFTQHALDNIQVRKLSLAEVVRVVENPEQVFEQENGRFAYQSRVMIRGRKHLLRAFVEHSESVWVVVSVYDTSKIAKYWRD